MISLTARTTPLQGNEVVASYRDTIFHAKLCSSDVKQFFLHNRTCGTVDIRDIHLSDSTAFGIPTTLTFPITLAADSSMPLELLFNARRYQLPNGVSPCRNVRMARRRGYWLQFRASRQRVRRLLVLHSAQWTDRTPSPGRPVIRFPLPSFHSTMNRIRSVSRQSQNHYLRPQSAATHLGDGSRRLVRSVPGSDDIRVNSSTPHRLSHLTPIAILHFSTFFAEPRSTQVALARTSLNDGDSGFARCMLTASATQGTSVSIAPFLLRFLTRRCAARTSDRSRIRRGEAEGTGATLHATVLANASATCHFTLVDMRGVVVQDFGDYSARLGSQVVILPVRLSSGVFELILESGGRRIGRRVSLVK